MHEVEVVKSGHEGIAVAFPNSLFFEIMDTEPGFERNITLSMFLEKAVTTTAVLSYDPSSPRVY